jgi:hypothetical protein
MPLNLTPTTASLAAVGRERSAALTRRIASPKRALRTASALLALTLAGGVTVQAQAQSLPDTQAEIEAAILAKKRAGGGKVVVAPGVIDVLELRVPSKIILAGSGSYASPTTTLRLKARSEGRAVFVGGGKVGEHTGNGIENIIIDGNRQNQPPDQYVLVNGKMDPKPRLSPLTLLCSDCFVAAVRVINPMYDGLLVAGGTDIYINRTSVSNSGRFGYFIGNSVNRVRVHNSTAQDTGIAFRYLGPGAGFGAGGTKVEFRNVVTRRTNGDGIAAYAPTNLDISVHDSTFYQPRNHCVHLGGDRPVLMGNKCYGPRLVGYYLANNFRPAYVSEREAVGGRINGNFVQDAGADGIKVQWYIADTQITSNSVNRTFNNSIAVHDSRGVSVTGNVARWPGYGRHANSPHCHLKIVNSQVSHSNNNFSYKGRTRPPIC